MSSFDPRTDSVIVGRSVELDVTMRHVLDFGQVLITGEPGVGKSTLLDALARRLVHEGFVVARVAGVSALVEQPLTALAHLTGDPANRTGADLVAFAVERLGALAPGSSAVILVDDAHALDPWSLHTLVQCRAGGGSRLVLASRGSTSLPAAVASVGRHPGMTLDIQRLSFDETAALSYAVLGMRLDTPSSQRVHRATDGLPLAIVELLRHAVRRSSLVDRAGLLRWDPNSSIDPHLASLLGLRVDELSETDRDAVDILAVVGELPTDTVRSFAPGVDVVALEEHHLISAAPRPGWVTVAHPLLRDASLSLLAPIRRRELIGRLISELSGTSDADLARLRIVLGVQVDADVDAVALRDLVAWGRAHGLWKQMVPVMERAWAECPDATTGLAYGEALHLTQQMHQAEQVFAAAEALCDSNTDRIALATARARTLGIGLGRADEADAVHAAQLDGLENPAQRLDVLCARCEQWLYGGKIDLILDVHAWAAKNAPRVPSAEFEAARYRLTQSSVAALGLAGRISDMVDEYQLHLELSPRNGWAHPLARELVDPWWVSSQLSAGNLERVRNILHERYDTAMVIDDGLSQPVWALPRAIDRWMAGDLLTAELFAREALGVPAHVVSIRRMANHYLARILEQSGRADEALGCSLETMGDDHVRIVQYWGAGLEHRCLVAGPSFITPADLERSQEHALAAVASAIDASQLVTAAFVAHDLVRAGCASHVLDSLAHLAEVTDAPSVRWMAAHARSVVDHDIAPLIDACEEAADAGCFGLALAFAEAGADLAVDTRDTSSAVTIEALTTRCETASSGRPVKQATSDMGARFGLSAREQQVARAAIAGLTDHQIATELFISVRTVNAHLRAVYRKLGIGGRRELRLV